MIFKIKYELGPTIAHLTSISTSLNFGLFYGAHNNLPNCNRVFDILDSCSSHGLFNYSRNFQILSKKYFRFLNRWRLHNSVLIGLDGDRRLVRDEWRDGHRMSQVYAKIDIGPIFLRRFKLYMFSFTFGFMFANICFEKNQNSKIYVMFIINITWNETGICSFWAVWAVRAVGKNQVLTCASLVC